MCEPTTLLVIGGMLFGADQQKKAAEKAAQASERQGANATAIASDNARIQRQKAKSLLARQRVAFAKSGVQMTGTPEEVLAQTAFDEEMNALSILKGGAMDADVARRNAAARRAEGKSAVTSTLISGATTLAINSKV